MLEYFFLQLSGASKGSVQSPHHKTITKVSSSENILRRTPSNQSIEGNEREWKVIACNVLGGKQEIFQEKGQT